MQKGKLSDAFNRLSASYHRQRVGVTLGTIGLVGGILIHAPLAIAFGAAAVGLFVVRAFAEKPAIQGPKVGDMMPDGTIYAGISPDTRKPMYTTAPTDAALMMTIDEAMKHAAKFDGHGHKDLRLPTEVKLMDTISRMKKP
jgi:hypothetical protein